MSLTFGLSTALSGLGASQKGLDLTSHNIVNRNTEGFTRKIFNPQSRAFSGFGAGVSVGEVTRRVDEGLRRSLREARGVFAETATNYDYSARVQDLFGKPGDKNSFSHAVSLLAKQFEALGADGSSSVQPDLLAAEAKAFAQKINAMSRDLQKARVEADQKISESLDKINGYLEQIADLNVKIALAKATGQGSADLEDKRDVILGNLSDYMDVKHYTGQNGEITLFTSSGTVLLANKPTKLRHSPALAGDPLDAYESGSFDGIWAGGVDITKDLRSGQLKALIDQRDRKLSDMQAQIDEMTRVMRQQINAAHNRGTSFPAMANAMTGTRSFIDPTRQRISLSEGDVAVTLFGKDGKQVGSAALSAILGPGTGAPPPALPSWTVSEVADRLQTWLRSPPNNLSLATVGFTAEGTLKIDLNSSEFSLGFRDQTSGQSGADAADASIGFDANGDGRIDRTIKGFSNFFGLNDFFENDRVNYAWDSVPLPPDNTVSVGFGLSFSNKTLGMDFGTVLVSPGDTPETIAERINRDANLKGKIKASVVRDGELVKLRITSLDSQELEITQVGGASPGFDNFGLAPTASGEGSSLRLAKALEQNHGRIARGSVQYDKKDGKYYLSDADTGNANKLAEVFSSEHEFRTAGGLSVGRKRFSDYAAAVIGAASSEASRLESDGVYQRSIVENLDGRDGQISGVNMDEEMAQLIVFEQSYSASARVISVIQRMFDTLTDMVR